MAGPTDVGGGEGGRDGHADGGFDAFGDITGGGGGGGGGDGVVFGWVGVDDFVVRGLVGCGMGRGGGGGGGGAGGGGGFGVVDCFCDFEAGDAGGACEGEDGARGGARARGDAELRRVLKVAGAGGDDLDAVARGLRRDAARGHGPGVGAGIGDVVDDAAVRDDVGGGALEQEDRDGAVAGCGLFFFFLKRLVDASFSVDGNWDHKCQLITYLPLDLKAFP